MYTQFDNAPILINFIPVLLVICVFIGILAGLLIHLYRTGTPAPDSVMTRKVNRNEETSK